MPLLLLLALVLAGTAVARDDTDPYWKYRSDQDRGELPFDESLVKPWVEAGVEVPPLPQDENLMPMRLDDLQDGMQAYLDADSVSVGDTDRVVRYWLVLKGEGGGYNATYEGMRCNTGEYKIYAYGNPNRPVPVKPAPDPKWRPVTEGLVPYRREMAESFLCNGISPKTVQQVRDGLRAGREFNNPYSEILHF